MRSPITSIQEIDTSASPSAIWTVAKLCLKLGRIDQSLTLAYSAVHQEASQQQLYKKRYLESVRLGAEFAEEIGDYSRAAYYWEQLTQQLPQDVDAWYGLGLALANLQDYRSAEVSLNRALQLEPKNRKVRLHLQEIQQLIRGW